MCFRHEAQIVNDGRSKWKGRLFMLGFPTSGLQTARIEA